MAQGTGLDEGLAEFVAETREAIEALDGGLVRFEQTPDDPELLGEIFRLVHTLKGACGFIGLPRLQSVAHAAETVLGGFRDGTTPVTGDAVSYVLEAVDLIREIVEGLARDGVEIAGDDSALIGRLWTVSQADGGGVAQASAPADAPRPAASARPLIDRLGGDATLDAACEMALGDELPPGCDPDLLQGALRDGLCTLARGLGDAGRAVAAATAVGVPAAAWAGLVARVCGKLRLLDVAADDADALLALALAGSAPVSAPAAAAPSPAARATGPGPSAAPEADAAAQTIRVGIDALEHLMTVASELVLIRNQLMQVLRLDPDSAFAAPLNRLNQVTSELQAGVMTTRMQPIHGAWAKLPRLVRDLARELGKEIELVVEGQETELDRQVLELIKDPLTHMIRNAVDHGVEHPADRIASGKPATGRIALSARHEGGAIVIEMSDDGRGLNALRIRAKALAQGLITPAQADGMSDAEVRRLIFRPGFSTAQEVTNVSGRGVGMDVVRTNIEKIGGSIELQSSEGAGTLFTISIPLTLTIVSALIVECCGERFAMPQSSLVELVGANDASGRRIEHIHGVAVLRLRDRLLPLVSLQALLGLPAEKAQRAETCIVVARVGACSFGVIVDRVFDTEEIVVKPVASVLRHLKIFSGATILGDGRVIMILDFKSMAAETGADEAAAREAEAAEAVAPPAPTETVLVFRTEADELKAARLAQVARIEELDPAALEHVDGRTVIQYRGRLMALLGVDGRAARAAAAPGVRPMLVFTRGEDSVGLPVGEIVDIVESTVGTDLKPSGPGSLGSLIIAGRAAELVDVDWYHRCAELGGPPPAPASAPPAGLPSAVAAGPRRRLLVVDRSPFSRLFLGPFLGQAGFEVTVAGSPAEAMALYARGELFDLILADTGGEEARATAAALAAATRWHATPLLGLGAHGPVEGRIDEGVLAAALTGGAVRAEPLRGAA